MVVQCTLCCLQITSVLTALYSGFLNFAPADSFLNISNESIVYSKCCLPIKRKSHLVLDVNVSFNPKSLARLFTVLLKIDLLYGKNKVIFTDVQYQLVPTKSSLNITDLYNSANSRFSSTILLFPKSMVTQLLSC